MKKILTALVLALFVVAGIEAQTLHVVVGKVDYAFSSAQTGQMNYADGKRVSIQGKEFEVGDITRMYVDDVAVDDNQVKVVYLSLFHKWRCRRKEGGGDSGGWGAL